MLSGHPKDVISVKTTALFCSWIWGLCMLGVHGLCCSYIGVIWDGLQGWGCMVDKVNTPFILWKYNILVIFVIFYKFSMILTNCHIMKNEMAEMKWIRICNTGSHIFMLFLYFLMPMLFISLMNSVKICNLFMEFTAFNNRGGNWLILVNIYKMGTENYFKEK